MDNADDLTFKIIFSGDGAGRLRDQVKEKLKEFMGDYTDDTLVEYVIVLLRNGRRKEEARNELNVFLGDDSDSFISWLWDHLQSNLGLYSQAKQSRPDEVPKQNPRVHSESEEIKSDHVSKNQRSKDWKGVVRHPDEPPPIRSAIIANKCSEDNNHTSCSPSPPLVSHGKRGRSGEACHIKLRSQVEREVVSKSDLVASRRLLQFAVRDAVATSRSTNLTSEPSFKRLRSVVSTPTYDSPLEVRQPPVTRAPKSIAVAIKPVADVVKVKTSGNVFDRLGPSADQFTEDDANHEAFTQIAEATDFGYNEEYNNISAPIVKSVGRFNNVMNGASNEPHRGQNSSHSADKPVNIYSNINPVTISNGIGVPSIHAQKEVQKTLPSASVIPSGQPTEDADSRTIFVNNVHFAATKDGILRHFNKFGEVLKVVIVTEPATGQPKGSAYVEFMRKEAAENALSLNGTSFMSRILKVVKKCSGQQEAAAAVAVTSWVPRVAWGSASRFSRGVAFPRGIGLYRSPSCLPMKGGGRSFQWKREAPSSDIQSAVTAATRSLTYVRPETAKAHGNNAAA